MPDFTFSVRTVGPSPEDPLSIYHLGQSFYLAGARCALNIETGPETVQSLLSPSVVNYCFSLELFFKALIQSQGQKPPRTHKLDDLYSALSEASRNAIQNGYSDAVIEPPLGKLLEDVANYFQQVRYEYEYPITVYWEHPIAMLARAVYIHCSKTIQAS